MPPGPPETFPQIMTTTAPVIIPAKAPMALKRFQYSDSRMVGPKEAPKPAQAKATRARIVFLPSHEDPGHDEADQHVQQHRQVRPEGRVGKGQNEQVGQHEPDDHARQGGDDLGPGRAAQLTFEKQSDVVKQFHEIRPQKDANKAENGNGKNDRQSVEKKRVGKILPENGRARLITGQRPQQSEQSAATVSDDLFQSVGHN